MTSTSRSDREKVGFDLRLDLGELETVRGGALAHVLGEVVGNVIGQVLGEPGVELDTLNVLVTPEASPDAFGRIVKPAVPDVLHVRAWAIRDRPTPA